MDDEQLELIPGAKGPFYLEGAGYDDVYDSSRLKGQLKREWECMRDQQWRTLSEIAEITNDPEASISANLRTFRKARFGGHTVNRRRRGHGAQGLWEYQLVPQGVRRG